MPFVLATALLCGLTLTADDLSGLARLAGHGFYDAERPCRLHHALQLETAPAE
jgi:hypothetical protein